VVPKPAPPPAFAYAPSLEVPSPLSLLPGPDAAPTALTSRMPASAMVSAAMASGREPRALTRTPYSMAKWVYSSRQISPPPPLWATMWPPLQVSVTISTSAVMMRGRSAGASHRFVGRLLGTRTAQRAAPCAFGWQKPVQVSVSRMVPEVEHVTRTSPSHCVGRDGSHSWFSGASGVAASPFASGVPGGASKRRASAARASAVPGLASASGATSSLQTPSTQLNPSGHRGV
jgi:hypothetical protein